MVVREQLLPLRPGFDQDLLAGVAYEWCAPLVASWLARRRSVSASMPVRVADRRMEQGREVAQHEQ